VTLYSSSSFITVTLHGKPCKWHLWITTYIVA